MAPKLVQVSSLGSLVQQANGNWRVRAQVDGKKYQGPWRATREQAHDDRTKARRATTRDDFVRIVQSLSRGGQPASTSQPRKRARKIRETLSTDGAYRAAMQAPSTLSTKRLRQKTLVPNCASASSSRNGPHSPQARQHLQVGKLRHKPATTAGVPSASGGGVRETNANSVSVIASLLQAATAPRSCPSARHDDHVNNHGRDLVDSHHGHHHKEHNGHKRDHDERDSYDHNVVASIPSINAEAAPKLRRSCADENGCGRCFLRDMLSTVRDCYRSNGGRLVLQSTLLAKSTWPHPSPETMRITQQCHVNWIDAIGRNDVTEHTA